MLVRRTKGSFFQIHSSRFNPLAPGLRECQIGAFCAVRSHFSVGHDPCAVSLPTGSGKTALMMALCFGLKARRALVINPAEVLRIQTRDKFESLNDLRAAQAIDGIQKNQKPKVYSVENELRYPSDWKALAAYDLVTATTRTTSPRLAGITDPPDGLFDLVFFDEGHHAAAATWKDLIERFVAANTKIVLLTGTPYRRDNRSIGAQTIYIYPIARAISDGIYAPVRLVTAGQPSNDARDGELADRGIAQLRDLRRIVQRRPLLFVKTDRKSHADSLEALYAKKGMNLGVVHSDRSPNENRAAVAAASAGKSDGLVVVGMLGEGLDIPALKVAVFHRNPQSLPYTLQVIGRLARPKENLPDGVVVACSDDFSRETFRLYDGSEDWLKLIPQLETQLFDQIAPRYSEQVTASGTQIQIADVRPHFSVTAHCVSRSPDRSSLKDRNFTTPRGEFMIVLDHEVRQGLRVFITLALDSPVWLKRHGASDILNQYFDVHTFYYGASGILLRQSSDETIGREIQIAISESGRQIEPAKLNHVMSSLGGDYLVLGLKNNTAIGHFQPSYKMLIGERVDGSVSNTDRASCHAGHCFMRRSDGVGKSAEFRGIAYKRSRIWSLDRDNINKLGEWMKVVAETICIQGAATLPALSGLRQPLPLNEYPGKPIAILPSSELLRKDVRFCRPDSDTIVDLPQWVAGSTTKQRLAASVPALGVGVVATIDNGVVTFTESSSSQWRVSVASASGESDYSFGDFIREYPPVFVFEDGSSWADGIYTRHPQTPLLDASCLMPQIWKGFDVGKEIANVPPLGDSVHEFVEKTFCLGKRSVIGICDHSQGEVADYVVFDSVSRLVSLYHCKAAPKNSKTSSPRKPGADQATIEELIPQGMSSCRWIRNSKLIEQLQSRIEKGIARYVCGSRADLGQLISDNGTSLWSFEIVLVQPGLDADKVKGSSAGKRIRPLLACAEDYIKGCGGTMKVLCS